MNEPKTNAVSPEEPTGSLIERAMRTFDRGQFVLPPMPSDMVPPVLHPSDMPQATAFQAPDPKRPEIQGQAAPMQAPAFAPSPRGPAYHPIDRGRLVASGMVAPDGAASAQVEEFRIVKRQLLEQAEDMRRRGGGAAAQRVMITSPHAGEGKTFCAINLALSIAAEKDRDVVLVDLDLARAQVLSTLGLPDGPGLIDAIADPALDLRDCVIATDVPGLLVLSGGHSTGSDAEYLASARASQVLEQLTEGAPRRIVLFDTPPVLATSLAGEIGKLSGQAVMVVRADATTGSAIQDAASLLAGCPNVQLLLNAVQFSPSGRRFGSYHGYRG